MFFVQNLRCMIISSVIEIFLSFLFKLRNKKSCVVYRYDIHNMKKVGSFHFYDNSINKVCNFMIGFSLCMTLYSCHKI